MKKWLWLILIGSLLAILVIPIPTGQYKDGGTREYTALTYKIVDWNRLTGDTVYDRTQVYFFPNNFRSVDALWQDEEDKLTYSFIATVLEFSGDTVLVQPAEGEYELQSCDRISFSIADLEDIEALAGTLVEVTYTRGIMESYPAQIHATGWKIADTLRSMEYTEQWLDKSTAEKYGNNIFDNVIITKIYSNCFFARPLPFGSYEIKLNGALSEDWCVGDHVLCTYENTYYDDTLKRAEVDILTVEPASMDANPFVAAKPVIYLYPQKETEVSVKLTLDGKLTCTYPAYENGWTVTASPDGTLTDSNGQTYNYLYWEGQTNARWDMTKGFCVKGQDTAAFLENVLDKLGLTRREANEFIVYWLPLMEQNPYNIISFQTDIYTDVAQLEIDPSPDTLLRVFMAWQAADRYIALPEQELTAPQRTGFTVVEWGGTEIS